MRNADVSWAKRRARIGPMLPGSRQICRSAKRGSERTATWPRSPSAQLREYLITRLRRRLFGHAVYGPGRYRRGSCQLPHYFSGIRPGLRAIEITPINAARTRALKNNEKKQRQPMHIADANRSEMDRKYAYLFYKWDCTPSILRVNLSYVRG